MMMIMINAPKCRISRKKIPKFSGQPPHKTPCGEEHPTPHPLDAFGLAGLDTFVSTCPLPLRNPRYAPD